MSTAVIGMPLKATEKAALAATPAASTFQRWLGGNEEEEEVEGFICGGVSAVAKVLKIRK
jgi:hypothetical protein